MQDRICFGNLEVILSKEVVLALFQRRELCSVVFDCSGAVKMN